MKYKNIIQTILFVLAVLLVGVFYLSINAPSLIVVSESFSIPKGESVASIASRLQQGGFIYSGILFRFYLKLTNRVNDVKAGYYLIPPRITLVDLANFLTESKNINDGIFLVKEGETLKDIEINLRQRNILTGTANLSDFRVQDFKTDYPLLFQSTPSENNLEGYFFPDSYHFLPDSSAYGIAKTLLSNFQAKIQNHKLLEINNSHNLYENLIMASLLEKEVQTLIDKRMVVDILWRRLKINMPLQVDAAICYAQNKSFNDCKLTKASFAIDSFYNTYLYKGLTPTPIGNPGLESLKAALNPLPNESWYYLTDRKTGQTIFSKTYEEHLVARAQYLK